MAVKHCLKNEFETDYVQQSEHAISLLKSKNYEILLLDVDLGEECTGLQLIPKILDISPTTSIIMISGTTEFQVVRDAMKLGAIDYISKASEMDDLKFTLKRALQRQDLIKKRNQKEREALQGHKKYIFVGDSSVVFELKHKIDKIKHSDAHVMITGETGTGKEIVARILRPSLADGTLAPFVAIDSATIQSSMAESILFGHEKGAFTGADKTTIGLFEEARGGIVYFDEIANMSLDIQAKLLRALQEKEIRRVGSTKTIDVDFRVICASNRDLEQMVKERQFKEDLLQRLNVLPIEIPPLRERIEDIPLLINYFLGKNSENSKTLTFSDKTMNLLYQYAWPGNVRELQNLMIYLMTFLDGNIVEPNHLPKRFHTSLTPPKVIEPTQIEASFYDRLNRYASQTLRTEYEKYQGNISKLASSLKMDRSHLYTKLREFKIHPTRDLEN
jgi:DNA-binding NtrC family response regulator